MTDYCMFQAGALGEDCGLQTVGTDKTPLGFGQQSYSKPECSEISCY